MILNENAAKTAYTLEDRGMSFDAFCNKIKKGMPLLQKQLDEEKKGIFISRLYNNDEQQAFDFACEYQNEIDLLNDDD